MDDWCTNPKEESRLEKGLALTNLGSWRDFPFRRGSSCIFSDAKKRSGPTYVVILVCSQPRLTSAYYLVLIKNVDYIEADFEGGFGGSVTPGLGSLSAFGDSNSI